MTTRDHTGATAGPADRARRPGLTARRATLADAALLAGMNQQRIEDEVHPNPMTLAELTARMQEDLSGADTAVLFELAEEAVAYALYRADGDGVTLRQFFVSRAHRGSDLGRAALAILIDDYLPPGARLTVEVLLPNDDALRFWEATGFRQHAITLERLLPSTPPG